MPSNGRYHIQWGAENPQERGPVIPGNKRPFHTATGVYNGTHAVHLALSAALGEYNPNYRPDLKDTESTDVIGPHPQWYVPEKIVSIDPLGDRVPDNFPDLSAQGLTQRTNIATKAHVQIPEIREAIAMQRLTPDGKVLLNEAGDCLVTKVAMQQVWHLPGIATRFGVDEALLRRSIHEQSGGMYPELIDRRDLNVFLPPIEGHTAYVFGDPHRLGHEEFPLSARIHDTCLGSDIFGSDICTCRPYLTFAIEECIKGAQQGGCGLIIYVNGSEGRAMGEVKKYEIYNKRKRHPEGDTPERYMPTAACVAGAADFRLYPLLGDALSYLGITRINRLLSMSRSKYDAISGAGIAIDERVSIPEDRIPPDARVEIAAKIESGYYNNGSPESTHNGNSARGRVYV